MAKIQRVTQKSIGKWMKNVRRSHGLSQIDVAKKLHISQGQLSKIEAGSGTITLNTYVRFIQITGESFGLERV